MATEQVIDVEAILQPIAGGNPAGKDVRDGKDFDVLKEARRQEEVLSQGDWQRDVKVADWPKAIQIATKILTEQSKDLQVATWLVEALIKRHGFAGLRDGLKILRGLHANFWDGLYPVVEALRGVSVHELPPEMRSDMRSATRPDAPPDGLPDGPVGNTPARH